MNAKLANPRVLIPVLAAVVALTSGCIVIEDGEVGVSKSFGTISDEPILQGIVIQVPVVRTVETWNIKLQELKEAANVPSSEGLLVGLETSLLFQVEADKAPQLRKKVGWNYVNKLIVPYFRSALRDIVAGYQVKNIYSGSGREQIAAEIDKFLKGKLGPEGVIIVDVLLRDVKLPTRFKESIEAKLTAEQRVQQKQFELEQARKDAEIEVARAEGAAKAQKIVSNTLNNAYLQYLWIKTLNENPNAIYVATEANLPIFKGVRATGQ